MITVNAPQILRRVMLPSHLILNSTMSRRTIIINRHPIIVLLLSLLLTKLLLGSIRTRLLDLLRLLRLHRLRPAIRVNTDSEQHAIWIMRSNWTITYRTITESVTTPHRNMTVRRNVISRLHRLLRESIPQR